MDDQEENQFPQGFPFGNIPGFHGFPGGPGANFFNMRPSPEKIREMKRQKLNINIKIDLSLEQIYQGIKHTLKYNKMKIQNNNQSPVEDEVSFEIKKGCSSKDHIEIKNKGHILIENNEELIGSLIININEQNNKIYERDIKNPANLICKQEITFIQALCGFQLILDHPSKNKIVVEYNDIISENKYYKMNNKGLPVYNKNNTFGDLIFKFNIAFPKVISDEEKTQLAKIFNYESKIENIDKNYLSGYMFEFEENDSETSNDNEFRGQHFQQQSVQCAQN
jgi:DnaJ family protein B protein 4